MNRFPLTRRQWLAHAGAAGLAISAGPRAFAQSDWPKQPIRLIVPYAPGGANDVTLRLVSKHVAEKIGQPILVDNRPGAGGVVGTNVVAKAPPDGYTVGVGATSTLIATPLTNPESTVDVQKDLVFVSLLAVAPMLLAVNTSVPVNSASELPAYLREQKGKLSYGSMAVGHFGHVVLKDVSDTFEAGMVHAAYKGEAPLLQDLISGQIQMALITPPAVRAMAEAKRVKLLAVSGTKRIKLFPNVPTFAEQGFKNPLYQMNAGWIGIIAPAGTPAEAVRRLEAEFSAAVKHPEVNEKISEMGLEPIGANAQTFAETFARERPVWRELLKKAGVQVRA
ncbi:tripartite tricarboxylate transporter substrate binding protein [Ramlibacter henchirensis]|uniref:Tripartite tricarboxylate transporter substrate binding protein n=1 Tax=Ramlibacter henchirensis TaxID=204072 RepID=A0A4Z0BTW2_9BURK|nr:tripartite tricarboxylate transporter substrate binding protein [Ramlibacter henchirensis]TFZ02723.1 tripartite tricarboxylate transporter substrate binding protein [Ramlibacter henchirensis]